MLTVLIYLAAIVAANISVVTFGPAVTPYTAFVLIGLDLILRDHLHDKWTGRQLAPRMFALIVTGGALSWVIQADAGRIAIASAVAFMAAFTIDAAIYHAARHLPWMRRANLSNVGGAAVDSLVFPTLAFGALMPAIVLGQFIAKVAGGFVWSWVIGKVRR